jgi:hypothetical protein
MTTEPTHSPPADQPAHQPDDNQRYVPRHYGRPHDTYRHAGKEQRAATLNAKPNKSSRAGALFAGASVVAAVSAAVGGRLVRIGLL